MANNEKQMDELDKMNSVLSTTEQWIEQNRKAILIVVAAAIIVVAGFLSIRQFYFIPQETKAQEEMYKGEFYFEQDSYDVALNGNGADFIGFKAVADEYSGTDAGNLANAYAGICAYNLGNNEEALEYLKAYSGSDALFYPNVLAMIGNCYANMGNYDEAMAAFVKAAKKASNELTSPIFLKKAAVIAEKEGDFAKAIELYQEIKDKYENSVIGQDIDKYIERTEAQVK